MKLQVTLSHAGCAAHGRAARAAPGEHTPLCRIPGRRGRRRGRHGRARSPGAGGAAAPRPRPHDALRAPLCGGWRGGLGRRGPLWCGLGGPGVPTRPGGRGRAGGWGCVLGAAAGRGGLGRSACAAGCPGSRRSSMAGSAGSRSGVRRAAFLLCIAAGTASSHRTMDKEGRGTAVSTQHHRFFGSTCVVAHSLVQ